MPIIQIRLLLISSVISIFFASSAKSQKVDLQDFSYRITATSEQIKIDGNLNEEIWGEVEVIGNFYQKFPQDSIPAKDRTEVMITRDQTNIYLAAICYLNEGETTQANTLFRDFPFSQNDAFAFLLEPYQDGLNGFSFEVTPYGSQGDRLISNGGVIEEQHSDYSWDNKWSSGVQNKDSLWIVEMAIPFKTLRYNSDMKTWGINFVRQNRSANTISSWFPIPVNLSNTNLAYTGNLIWDTPPKSKTVKYSLIPSTTLTINRDYRSTDEEWTTDFTPSLDFKLNIGPSLNIDGTINPDFSQIEVDQRQLNIGRFEISLPERRQFFIENSDLFANFGNGGLRPFFSRRIGLVRKENEVFEQVPILGGLRFSGKLGEKTRMGAMVVQTDNLSTETEEIAGRNYSAATIQQQIFGRSTLSAIFVNTQNSDGLFKLESNSFNRVSGVQLDWISKDSKWTGNNYFFTSSRPENNNLAYGGQLNYRSTHLGTFAQFYHIDEGFNPDTGFVPRSGINQLNLSPFYTFRPKNGKINFMDVFVDTSYTFSKEWRILDSDIFTGTFISLSNTSNLLLVVNPKYTFLLNDFDPSFSGSLPLPAGSSYTYSAGRVRYRTDQRSLLSGSFQVDYGQYFNGVKLTTTNTVNLRWQPVFQFSLDFIYNYIDLPEPFGDNEIFLVRPEARISFSEKLFLSYISQYSSLLKTIGSNLRLQWRFKPASDIFFVYTDNYSDQFNVIQRGFSAKVIYWF